jgi:prepilin-type N-terminal cleavage/methylation domain-containing protein
MTPSKTYAGFTLIELVISVTILVIGVLAVFSLAIFTINLNQENMTKIQALELAREGLEMVRNIRDSNWKNNYPFNGGVEKWGENLDVSKTVIISPTFSGDIPWKVSSVVVSEQTRESYRLQKASQGGISVFTHEELVGAEPSNFYRYITILPKNENTFLVTAIVFWMDKGKEQKVDLSTVLTNWKKI